MKDIEVCAYSLESCKAAKAGGATRVELCASPFEGGTTPSAGCITGALEILQGKLELYVMIRPRGGDFLYTNEEFTQMEQEIEFVKSCRHITSTGAIGINGVVFGLLRADGTIDTERTARLVQRAKSGASRNPLGVTFHRAFDMSTGALSPENAIAALNDVITTGADRILTSGFRPVAEEGKDAIGMFVKEARQRIEIMAGSGVNPANAKTLAQLGIDALHLSGKSYRDSQMTYQNPHLSMGAKGIPEYSILHTNTDKVKAVVKAVQTYLQF